MRHLMTCMLACCALLTANATSAQTFPAKPIRIVTLEPGGGTDFAARTIAQALAGSFSQPVIVENRGGANGVIAAQIVSRALPDGYTLLLNGSLVWLLPLLQDNVPYDPVKDFAPVALVTSAPNLLVIHSGIAAGSVKELIALAKSKPGALNYGSAATGGSPHLAAELFKAMAGADIVRVPYKGAALALNDVLGGRVQMMFPTAATVAPHLKSDRLRILAVTTGRPSALFPALPTIAATLPGYESASLVGVFAPAKTPVAIVQRLNREIVSALDRPDVKDRFFNSGVETVGGSVADFAGKIRSELARMGKVIMDANIRGE